MAVMDDEYFRAVLSAEIESSAGFLGGELSDQRSQAMDYYYSKPFGNERDGKSQIVLSDVLDTVEWAMPSLMRTFFGGSKVVKFNATDPSDEDEAEAKTEYVNYVFRHDNPGFELAYMWMKDALLQKNGILKVWWEEDDDVSFEHYQGLFPNQLEDLLDDPEVEILEQEEVVDEAIQALLEEFFGADQAITVWNVKIKRTETRGRVMAETVPPEEFLISRNARGIRDAIFMAHRVRRTCGELIEMGYDPDLVYSLPDAGEDDYTQERRTRESYTSEYFNLGGAAHRDPSMREVWVFECYIKLDYDQDGIAELRKVVAAGEQQYVILENEDCDAHPFHSITPIPIPHTFYGLSLADLVADLQLIRSTVMRQLMDNIYLINNGRMAVSKQVNVEDALTNRAGGLVRVATTGPDVAGHFHPFETVPIVQHIAPVMDILRDEREARTGITRYNQGLDADTLNDTATGISKVMAAANQRIELIARVFAETGFTTMAKGICELLIKHQDRPRMVKLREKWTEIDPRTWRSNMNTSVDVGLGYDNKEQEALFMKSIMEVQAQMVAAQKGLEGPMVNRENIYKAAAKLSNAMGFPHAEHYFMDPTTPEAQQAAQRMLMAKDPETVKNEQEYQVKQGELMLKDKEIEYDYSIDLGELEVKAAQVGLQEDVAQMDHKAAMEGHQVSRDTAGMRANGSGNGVARPANGKAPPDPLAEALQGIAEAMTALARGMSEQAAAMALALGPKEVIRDSKGVIQGVQPVAGPGTIQ